VREKVSLRVRNAQIAHALELVECLHSLRYDARAELGAEIDEMSHDHLLAALEVNISRERQVELDHGGLELDDSFQVRVARAEVVHDEASTGALR